MNSSDRELLVRIDERVAVIQREIKIYRRDLDLLKKKVYSICGGLAVVHFFEPFIAKFFGGHSQ